MRCHIWECNENNEYDENHINPCQQRACNYLKVHIFTFFLRFSPRVRERWKTKSDWFLSKQIKQRNKTQATSNTNKKSRRFLSAVNKFVKENALIIHGEKQILMKNIYKMHFHWWFLTQLWMFFFSNHRSVHSLYLSPSRNVSFDHYMIVHIINLKSFC